MDTSRYSNPETEIDSSLEADTKDLESRRPQHMAFTIHFDDANKNTVSTKFTNDKVSNYALKHRRNQSLPPTDEYKTTKGEVNSTLAVCLSPLSPRKSVTNRVAGYHSEGYFSSDQDEDPRNRKGLFVRKLKNIDKGVRTTNLAQEKKNMAEQNSQTKLNNSPHMSRHEFGDFHVEDTKLKSRLDELKYLNSGMRTSYNQFQDEEEAKNEWLMSSTMDDQVQAQPQTDLLVDYEDDNDNEFSNDTASETGTYTIERDIPCPEEELARLEINNVVSEGAASLINQSTSDFKMNSSRSGMNWINDWATQVAKHTHLEPEAHLSGLPPLPTDKHKGSVSITTRIPSPVHSPTLPPSGRRHTPISPTRPLHLAQVELADETESYLRATESVVTAMQARMSLSRDSGSESDVDLPPKGTNRSHSSVDRNAVQRQSSGASDGSPRHLSRRAGQSDSGSETSDLKVKKEEPLLKYNRAFSLRRARLDVETVPSVDTRKKIEPISSTVTKSKKVAEPARPNIPLPRTTKSSSPKREPAKTFSRTDCGRFSVRTPKAVAPQSLMAKTNPPAKKDIKKDTKKSGGRSNSTLSSREVEFQNWKRRKSYDPMKAAAEGKKKDAAKKATFNNSMTQSYIAAEELSPSHQSSVLRSASFHGTLGMSGVAPKYLSSEEEVTGEEDEIDSPPNECVQPLAPVLGSPNKSCDGAFGGSRASLHSNASNSSFKGRTKPEALDSLVMAALCGLSTKLRGRSCIVLKKLRYLYEEDAEKSEQLSAIIELLETPASLDSPQSKSQSNELSETLKNLKRLEGVFNVLDEVLFDDEDFEELDADNFQ